MCFPSMRRLLFSLDVGGRHLKDGSLEGFELGLGCAVLAVACCRISGLTALNSLLQYINWLVWEVFSVN